MLLNNTPDTSGLIPEKDAASAKAFGQEIKRRYSAPIVASQGRGDTVEAQPSAPVMADTVVTMEDITQGERVRKYEIQGLVDGSWKTLVNGTAVGHKKFDHFDPTQVAAIRIHVLQSVGEPIIKKIALYRVTPPQ